MAESLLASSSTAPLSPPDLEAGQGVLTQQALSYFKLLTVLRKQLTATAATSQVGVVTNIARWLDAAPVLTLIARTPHWYCEWQIKEALYSNPRTPRRIREEIGRTISIFELMRELDRHGLKDQEKAEIREDIKSLFTTLSGVDKSIVKARAYRLSSSNRQATAGRAPTLETPLLPDLGTLPEYSLADLLAITKELQAETGSLDESFIKSPEVVDLTSLSVDEQMVQAQTSGDSAILVQALGSDREDLLSAVLTNPNLSELHVLVAATENPHPAFFRAMTHQERWYQQPEVRSALLKNPHLPPDRKLGLTVTEQLPSLFEAIDEGGDRAQAAAKTLGRAIDHLGAEDLIYALETAKVLYPHLVHLIFAAPAFTGQAELPLSVADEADIYEIDHDFEAQLHESSQPAQIGSTTDQAPEPAVSRVPSGVELRAHEAATVSEIGQIALFLTDPDDRVFAGLLQNPALPEDMIVGYARTITADRAQAIYRDPRWSGRHRIQEALLDNPKTPHGIALELLNFVSNPQALLKVVKNPKIATLEVKQKALQKLIEIYRALDSSGRISLIKATNGEILHELWEEAFHDEETITTLLKEQYLEDGIVLKVVRSKSAPRSALAAIGANPAWVNNYQIRLELVMNPKTPRDVVARLISRLNPTDRAKIKNNRNLPEYVRAMV
ncbi:MAG: hypothetical protein HY774_13915 [Acidobacteria bacterium]|nr:hypothetical protein [Acidobacteriota bacterium]